MRMVRRMPELPICSDCEHYAAIHGQDGCVAATGCTCKAAGK